jgi:hypothetical protein
MRSAPEGHTLLERRSGVVLGFAVGIAETAVAVVGCPVVFVTAIDVIHGVLRLVSAWVDEREILGNNFFSVYTC